MSKFFRKFLSPAALWAMMSQIWLSFRTDSLFRNAAYLMMSAGIAAALGFGFWVLASHLYTPSDIGVASALISISMLITNLSFFGLNQGLVRFLPASKDKSRDVNAAFMVVAALAAVATAAYLALSGSFEGPLAIFSSSGWGRLVFIVLMVVVCLNALTDKVFVASRRAEFHTIVYAVFGLVKLLLPLFLIPYGSLGIFVAYIVAATVALVLSLVLMRPAIGYQLWARPDWSFITRSRRYATNNYLAVLASGLPGQLMPVIIISRLGNEQGGFFALAWMMANLIYVIPSAITNSILAEASHDEAKRADSVRRGVKLMGIFLLLAVALSCLVAPYILHVFGEEYAEGATVVFQLLALMAFPIAANAVGNTIMNIEHRTGGIVVVQAVTAAVTLLLVAVLMNDDLALVGVGLAMIGGAVAGNVVQLGMLLAGPPAGSPEAADPTTPVSDEVVRALLAQYGLDEAITTRGGYGASAVTYVVQQAAHKYVLKVYRDNRRVATWLDHEAGFTEFLKSRGVPAIVFIHTQVGASFARVASGDNHVLAVLMPFESGQHPTQYTADLVQQMAALQARIHLGGVEYAASLGAVTRQLSGQSLRSSLLGFMPHGVSHFDFDATNLLVEGGKIVSVLDFESMRYDPLVVCMFFSLTCIYSETRSKALLSDYLRNYQVVRRLTWRERWLLKTGLALRYRSVRLLTI